MLVISFSSSLASHPHLLSPLLEKEREKREREREKVRLFTPTNPLEERRQYGGLKVASYFVFGSRVPERLVEAVLPRSRSRPSPKPGHPASNCNCNADMAWSFWCKVLGRSAVEN